MSTFENYFSSITGTAIRPLIKFIPLLILFTAYCFPVLSQDTAVINDTISFSNKLITDTIASEDMFIKPYQEIDQIGIQPETIEKTAATKEKKKKKEKTYPANYSAKNAALWATGFPGLGQVYNKKYWKLPIVYGLIGTMLYFVVSNGMNLVEFNGYITNVYDNVPNPAPYDQLELSDIESLRDTYRRNVQLAAFGTIFAWGLSIVDASVDAHMRGFDISDNLSMKVKPELNYSNFTYYTGIGVNLNFK